MADTSSRGFTDPDIEILGPEDADRKEQTVRKDFWKTVKRAAKQVPFMEEIVASYYCALDPKTPSRVRYTILGALAYFVLPIDTIPDFIFGIGFTDDAAVLMAALAAVRSHVRDVHRDAARDALAGDELPDERSP